MSAKDKKQAESNIQTFLRVKPSKLPSGYFNQDDIEKGSLLFNLPSNFKTDYVNNSKLNHGFHFNGVIQASATQEEVFKTVGIAAVQNAIDGFNSTIFAYGQTGSGKTYTLTGGYDNYRDRGIIPRSISMLFNEFRTRTDMQFKAYISYLELYNEQGYDLLDPSHESKALEDLPKVSILEDEHGNFHLKNLSMHPAETEEEALNLLFMGETNRAIAETPMNLASSRSHCIFSLSLEARIIGSDKVRRSKLHLVDLAGSERVAKTNSSGSILTEAKYINSSLFFLEMVIVALYEKATKGRTHIPYRNSMMTSVLRDSLGGNCKTIMIATINPEASHTEESLSTCKFAQRVSLIKNKALINEEMDPTIVIRRLKGELLTLREEIAYLKGESGEGEILSPQQIDDLQKQCRQYCYDINPQSTLNIGTLTLTKIKDAFAIMKNLVLEANSSSNNRSITNGSNNVDEDMSAVNKQINDLKSLLIQRDSEIAILVNMVKKGKTVGDIQRSSRGGDSGNLNEQNITKQQPYNNNKNYDSDDKQQQSTLTERKLHNHNNNTSSNNSTTTTSNNKSYQQLQYEQHQEREKDTQELIIKRHLFGVSPPTDMKIFDDAALSFDYFCDKCQLNQSLTENKELLKEKIIEAKTIGERANHSRSTINYLKNSIEAIRREKVLQKLNNHDEQNPQDEVETEDEVTYRRAIDQEKVIYKESFDRLRVLKPEIEHIRKLIEKCRSNIQNQFDQWYSNLHARNNVIVTNHTSTYANHSNNDSMLSKIDNTTISSSSTTTTGISQSKGMHSNNNIPLLNLDNKHSSYSLGVATSSINTSIANTTMSSSMNSSFSMNNNNQYSNNNQYNTRIADSKSIDNDDVNEDIQAFYQAKEELLKRRNASSGR